MRTFRLPNRLVSMVEVSDRFHLKPLLRSVTFPQAALVLALAHQDRLGGDVISAAAETAIGIMISAVAMFEISWPSAAVSRKSPSSSARPGVADGLDEPVGELLRGRTVGAPGGAGISPVTAGAVPSSSSREPDQILRQRGAGGRRLQAGHRPARSHSAG